MIGINMNLTINGIPLKKSFKFPGGELNIQLPLNELDAKWCDEFVIKTILNSSDKIIELLLVTNALNHYHPEVPKRLIIHYLPYARQDRICNYGEAFSLLAFARLINSMNFDSVVVYDAHSTMSTKLVDRCINVPREDLMYDNPVYKWLVDHDSAGTPIYLVSPDAGSVEKSKAIKAKFSQIKDIIFAEKVRDTLTGKILKTVVNYVPENIDESVLLVCDDIGDGFGSFLPLAEQLRTHNPREISIYVTHGIFSKGEEILHPLFDNVWCTIDFRKFQ